MPTLALHLLVANRYDVFRDELYFIVCGRHPSFGYADQPPLVPLLAAALYALGAQTWVLRLPVVVASALLVFLVVRFVRLLGGGNAAATAAGLCAAFAPMFLGLLATFNTTAFEPLAWTTVACLLARTALRDERRGLVWAGVVAGLAFEAKYALIVWLVALLAGLALTPQRRMLTYRELWAGVAVAIVLALPSVVWQAAHGWPFVDLVRAAGDKNAVVAPVAFVLNQVLVMNPLFAPVWIAGIVAPFARRDLAPLRFVAIAFVVAVALTMLSHGKDYYVAAAYPALFAIGAVALERLVRSAIVRVAYLGAAVALSAVAAPTAMPILPPADVPAYMARLHIAQQQQERGASAPLPQTFADELGWHDFVREVGTAYASLPASERDRTSVLVDNYGEAAALDVYGAPYGLPPALAGHNQYWYFGPRGQDPRNVLRVQRHVERLRPYCARVRVLGTTSSPFAMGYENGKTIAFCDEVKMPIAKIWPQLREMI